MDLFYMLVPAVHSMKTAFGWLIKATAIYNYSLYADI